MTVVTVVVGAVGAMPALRRSKQGGNRWSRSLPLPEPQGVCPGGIAKDTRMIRINRVLARFLTFCD